VKRDGSRSSPDYREVPSALLQETSIAEARLPGGSTLKVRFPAAPWQPAFRKSAKRHGPLQEFGAFLAVAGTFGPPLALPGDF